MGRWNRSINSKKIQLLGLDEKIYLCDTFERVVKAIDKDDIYIRGEHADANIEYINNLIYDLNLSNIKVLKDIFPDETGFEISEKIRLCHIDVDVYKSTKDIVHFIWDKLIINGIIVFDDFGLKTCKGISINKLNHDKDKMVFENLNVHAVIIKWY